MKPKDRGLCVINLTLQNEALLLKQLDKFYKKKCVQWVKLIWNKYYKEGVPHLRCEKGSLLWKDTLRLHSSFRGMATYSPNKGDAISLWEDVILWSVFLRNIPIYTCLLQNEGLQCRNKEKRNMFLSYFEFQ